MATPTPAPVTPEADDAHLSLITFPPLVNEELYHESLAQLTSDGYGYKEDPKNGVFHLYVFPAASRLGAPQRTPADGTSSFWGFDRSHVHIIFGGASRFDVQNGLMTVNRVAQGQQAGTEIWHPRLQGPRRGRFFEPLDAAGVRNAMDQEVLWNAVTYLMDRGSTPELQAWRTMGTGPTAQDQWTPRGIAYRDQWTGLMGAISRMCSVWWGPEYLFPVFRQPLPPRAPPPLRGPVARNPGIQPELPPAGQRRPPRGGQPGQPITPQRQRAPQPRIPGAPVPQATGTRRAQNAPGAAVATAPATTGTRTPATPATRAPAVAAARQPAIPTTP